MVYHKTYHLLFKESALMKTVIICLLIILAYINHALDMILVYIYRQVLLKMIKYNTILNKRK